MGDLNRYIDHTCLKPYATEEDIQRVFEETKEHEFASACVAPCWLDETLDPYFKFIHVSTVVGFPHGNCDINEKITSCVMADEYDVVANVGYIKSGKWDLVEREIRLIRAATRKNSTEGIFKYIVEVGYLTDEELFRVSDILIMNNVDYIKTCTGYGPRGVEIEDIKKIKNHVGKEIFIKASGGIKTRDFAEDLIAAGANRIGCSNSLEIIK